MPLGDYVPTRIDYTLNHELFAPAAAAAVQVTPTGVNWGWSPWVEVEDVTDADWVITGLMVRAGPVAGFGVPEAGEVQIGIGAAAAEVAICTVPGAFSNVTAGIPDDCSIDLSISLDAIPAGSRVSVRLRFDGAVYEVDPWHIVVRYLRKPIVGRIETTANPIEVSAPGSISPLISADVSIAWTYGAWVELIASAPYDLAIVGVSLQVWDHGVWCFYEFGVGAAAAEVPITELKVYTDKPTGPLYVPLRNPITGILAGQRVAVRMRSDNLTARQKMKLAYVEVPL
jgi:hypothetical protein